MKKIFADYIITKHAQFELKRRDIKEELIRSALREPGQSFEVRKGRIVVQSRIVMENKLYLIRIFVDIERHPAEVVTVYRTSKIEKYWRKNQ